MQVLSREQRRTFFCSLFPRYSKLLGVSSVSTILAGTVLFGYISSVDTVRLPTSWGFVFIAIGAVLGLVGIVITLGVVLPLGSKFIRETSLSIAAIPMKDSHTKEGTLDEETMLSAIRSSLTAISIILGIVLTMMTLGANL